MKPAGQGVSERRIAFGPGYRLYFGQDDKKIVVLLTGGTKRTLSGPGHSGRITSRERKEADDATHSKFQGYGKGACRA